MANPIIPLGSNELVCLLGCEAEHEALASYYPMHRYPNFKLISDDVESFIRSQRIPPQDIYTTYLEDGTGRHVAWVFQKLPKSWWGVQKDYILYYDEHDKRTKVVTFTKHRALM
ncbi:MAG: hypothetical protein ABSC01_05815 [Verrucomicrobiota bacterium]